jgi:hypothetical protein
MSARRPRPCGNRPNALAAISRRRRLVTRTMPHEAHKASIAASSLAIAPVCAESARPPISLRPPNRAITGLVAATLAGDGAKALVILDRLDIQQRGADLGSVAQPAEIVLDAVMDRVADRHHRGERQVAGITITAGSTGGSMAPIEVTAW